MALDIANLLLSPEEDALFGHKPFDYDAARKKFNARLDRAEKQVKGTQGTQGGKDWQEGFEGRIRFKPTLNGHQVLTGLETEAGDNGKYIAVHKDNFTALITALKGKVNAKEYDEQIKAASEASAPVRASQGSGSKAKKSSGEKPWTVRKDWADLSTNDKRAVSSAYRWGKNPDQSIIAEVGHKPDAPIVRATEL